MTYYDKISDTYRLVLYGYNDANRNADGTSTSLGKSTVARTQTNYIINIYSQYINCKRYRFLLDTITKMLSEDAILYLHSYTCPIFQSGNSSLIIKLVNDNDGEVYDNLSNDNTVILANYHTINGLTPSDTTTTTTITTTDPTTNITTSIITTTETKTTVGATTTITDVQTSIADFTTYFEIFHNLDNVYPTKVTGVNNDWWYLFTDTINTNSIQFFQNVDCDVLLIGGGGNGGTGNYAGGGGAGEVVVCYDYTFPASTYILTVGNNTHSTTIGSIFSAKPGGTGGSSGVNPTSNGGGYGGMSFSYPTVVSNSSAGTLSTISTDKYFIYKSTGTNSITFPQNTVCDIMMIGGGGGGGFDRAAGGGAGACLVYIGYTFTTGTYNITVGTGGTGATSVGTNPGTNGGDSKISLSGTDLFVVKGGGGGPAATVTSGIAGGCSSGGPSQASYAVSPVPVTTNVIPTNSTSLTIPASYCKEEGRVDLTPGRDASGRKRGANLTQLQSPYWEVSRLTY